MKKTLLLKTMLLLCAIIVGSSSVWAQNTDPNWSYTVVNGDNSKLNTTTKKFTVDATHVWSYDGTTVAAGSPAVTIASYSSTYGLKFGSSGTVYFNPVILSTTAFNDKAITKVSLKLKHNGGKVGKLTVKQGEVTVGTYTTSQTSDWITVTCSETNKGEGGALEIKYEVAQALYINKIEVWYDDLGTTHTLSSAVLPSGAGTVALGSTTIVEEKTTTVTATANDGYRFVNWTVTGEGSSVSDATDNPTTFTMGTEDATITANFEAIPTHTVTWSVNGVETTNEVEEGAAVTFPANPADLGGKKFMGWTATAIDGTTDEAPAFVTSATMGTSDLKYYAVFATGTGSPATLTKMASDETLSDGDKIVIVANDGTTEYALYQKESKTTYIDKYVFDGQVETVAADDLNWVTANAEADEKWSFGDATNGYIYNSSKNEFKIDKSNKTSFTVAFNSDNNGFTIKNGSRWFAYRADLTEANQLFRGAGNSTTPTDGSVAYFDIYKYVAGNANYSGYCTSVNATATIPANKEWITFCSPYNLDFTSDIAGLEGAYTITAHENQATTLTATKMTGKVKAGTGLLLHIAEPKTTAQLISIPVAATGEEQADNMLKGVTEDTEIAPTTGEYTNLGLKDGEFHPYTNGPSDMAKLKAGKAYLQVPTAQMPTGGNNARLYIVLDGEATGINAIENSELRIENLDAPMYNLAGQRVTKSYKGVVIVNGKKYINK